MAKWMAISRQRHQNAGWQKASNFTFAQAEHVAPVLLQETSKLLTAGKVLALVPQGQKFVLVTLQSLRPEENWFVRADGRWLGGYIPAYYRGYPFRLLAVDANNAEQKVLCVDTDSSLWSEEAQIADLPVFGTSEALADEMNKLLQFLQQCENNRLGTQDRVNELQQAGLVVPWKIKWQAGKGEKVQQVAGLFRFDEQKLGALAAAQVKALTDSGALGLLYAQLLSMPNIPMLQMLGQARESQKGRQGVAVSTEEQGVDLGQLFGGDGDVLKF